MIVCECRLRLLVIYLFYFSDFRFVTNLSTLVNLTSVMMSSGKKETSREFYGLRGEAMLGS